MKTKKHVSDIKVSNAMTKRVETLSPNDTIRNAVNLMLDCKLTAVPVIDGRGKCIGILSSSDLTEMFLQEDGELSHVLDNDRLSRDWLNRSVETGNSRKVEEFMTIDVATIQSNQTLSQACQEMARHKIHHLPVVSDEDSVVGILSSFDIVKAVAES